MRNTIPNKIMDMVTMAQDIAAGAAKHGPIIPLVQHTEAYIRARITPVVDAIMALNAAEKELRTRRGTLNGLVVTAHAFLTLARDSFKPALGNSYNEDWDQTGLRGSLIIPRNDVGVLGLLRSFDLFLQNNPTLEVPQQNKDITAARAKALLGQLSTARAAVGQQKTQVENLLADRNVKIAALRLCIRGTINELATRLSPLDPLYASFGLNKPGAVATPDVVQGVTAVKTADNVIAVKWPAAPRADHYRVWQKVVGVDQEFIAIGNPSDPDFTIEKAPPNATIEIVISAVNAGGESMKSEVLVIQSDYGRMAAR